MCVHLHINSQILGLSLLQNLFLLPLPLAYGGIIHYFIWTASHSLLDIKMESCDLCFTYKPRVQMLVLLCKRCLVERILRTCFWNTAKPLIEISPTGIWEGFRTLSLETKNIYLVVFYIMNQPPLFSQTVSCSSVLF